MNIRQIVFDIENEYLNIANNTDSVIYNSKNFNLLYIPESMLLKNRASFLDKKIEFVYLALNSLLDFSLDKYENSIKKAVKEVYNNFKITDDTSNMYTYSNINKKYRECSSFPSQIDLIKYLIEKNILPKTYIKLLESKPLVKDYSDLDAKMLDDKTDTFIVFDLKSLDTTNFDIYLSFAEEYYGDKLLIYIDEMWKIINAAKDRQIDVKISELFKTIRKNNAGIIVISQDIHDVLKHDKGAFGKSILNNAYTKMYFKMQYMDLEQLRELGIYSEKDISRLRKLIRGQAFMNIGDSGVNVDIKSSEFEKMLIEGGDNFEKSFNSN